MHTPHLDALAADSVTFTRAYVAVAWCSPSRTALLTSRRPDTSRTWSVSPSEYWRQRGGNFTTLPQLFKDAGYLTLGIGKIFHPGTASGYDDPISWSPENLPYDDTGSRCPSAATSPPVPAPPGAAYSYACRAARCIEQNVHSNSSDRQCSGQCGPLQPSEWLAVSFLSTLSDENRTLTVHLRHGQEISYLKKSERLSKELPPQMLRQIKDGQRITLARPAIAIDETYYLIELDDDAVISDGNATRDHRLHPSMVAGPNSDSAVASCAVRTLHRLGTVPSSSSASSGGTRTNEQEQFFFAVGLHKPHIPWNVPQRWYDLYPLGGIELPTNDKLPVNVPPIAPNQILQDGWPGDFSDFGTLRANGTIDANGSIAGDYWAKRIRQSYWAAVSYTDDNVGQIIQAAKETGLYQNISIVFLGDHGESMLLTSRAYPARLSSGLQPSSPRYSMCTQGSALHCCVLPSTHTGFQLGENHQYSKVTNWEHSLRIPLMIKPPVSASRTRPSPLAAAGLSSALQWNGIGRFANGFVEAVDLLPTIAELALPATSYPPVPRCSSNVVVSRVTLLCTDGNSILQALHDPSAPLRSAAYSQVPRNALVQGMQGSKVAGKIGEIYMGYLKYSAETFSLGHLSGLNGETFSLFGRLIKASFRRCRYTLRTDSWRYTEYFPFDPARGMANWSATVGVELYRHSVGDEEMQCRWDYESVNIAGDPKLAGVEAQLAEALRAGFSDHRS